MKLANVDGRACAVSHDGGVDLAGASDGRFPVLVDDNVAQLDEIAAWLDTGIDLDPSLSTDSLAAQLDRLGPPVTRPAQIFGIGLNYADHAAESNMELPEVPLVFTKFVSSIAGAGAHVPVLSKTYDWEVELVAVIGTGGRDIAAADALSHVAGFCVGQDISDRRLQLKAKPPQFSLGKSRMNGSPMGPWLTTLDELGDPNDLGISCSLGDEVLQSSRTTHMIFDTPTLIEYLSTIVELLPGDVIFTGTPDGVGSGRDPRRFIEPGWRIDSTIEGLGSISTNFVEA